MSENIKTKTTEEYRLIFDAGNDVLITVRLNDGIVIDASKEFTTLLGYIHDEIIGKSYNEICLTGSAANHLDSFAELTFKKKDGSFFEKVMSSQVIRLSADGTNEERLKEKVQEFVFQTREKEDRAEELAAAYRELTFQNGEKDKRAAELVMANKELAYQNGEIMYLIFHDKLTGLANREFYMEELKRLDTADNLPLTVIVGDVNGLTQINDSFGDAAGDELLKKFAGILKKSCRPKDIISRISGDEFVILLPKTDAFEAEAIIKQMTALSLREKVGSMKVSISFGSETKQSEEDEIQVVLKQAGKYMYEQKNAQ